MKRLLWMGILLGLMLVYTVPALGNEPVTIVMAGWAHPDDVMEGLAEFEQAHPGIRVEYRYVEGGTLGYTSQVALWAVGGTLPDVLPIPFWSFFDLLEVGALMGLDDLIARDQEVINLADFLPGAVEAHQYQGVTYGLPSGMDMMIIIANHDLFLEKGLMLPGNLYLQGSWSIETMIDAAKKLTTPMADGRLETTGVYMATNQLEFLAPYIWAYGGQIFSDDGLTCLLDSPEALEAVETLVSLLQEDRAFVSTAQRGHFRVDWWDALAGGDAGMLSWWISTPELIKNQGATWELGLVPFPKGVTERTSLVASHAIGISVTSAHKEEAWELVKFITSESRPREDATGLPTRISWMGIWMDNMRNNLGIQGAELIGLAQNAMRVFARPVQARAKDIVAEMLQRALLGQISSSTAVREAARLAQGALQQ